MARDDDYDEVELDDEGDRPRGRRRRRYEERLIGDDPGMRLLLPVGRSAWAILAGYLGLLSVLFVPAPFALACGIIAIMDMKRHPEKHGMGRAIFGIVMGTCGSIVLFAALASLAIRRR